MRILVHQPFHMGHHYRYISCLLPALVELPVETVVAITPAGANSPEFQVFLQPFADRVRFESRLPESDPSLPMNERMQAHRDLRTVVRDLRPDYVLIPSGDAQATAMAAFRLIGAGALPGRVPCEIGLHFGTGGSGRSAKRVIRDTLNELNLAASGLERILIVNLLYFEDVRQRPLLRRRAGLMPQPIESGAADKRASRQRLGLPEDGRYIGLAASFDARKAVPQMLAAFRDAAGPSDRVLLAGWMVKAHRQVIERDFQDLIRSDRLFVRQGFLPPDEYRAAVGALDVVCTPYPGFPGLSLTVLEAAATGRPVLVHNSGWSGEMLRRFPLGWACDVLDHAAFTAAIRHALDTFDSVTPTESVRRLLAFHSTGNFARTWTAGLRTRCGLPSDPPHTWDWVEAAAVTA